ncbi:Crp/Fnr family transcriptional regulator [Thioclava sp.]|uniref:Crp/Fnr family transcriptional regulator n=1 Tax=Thioclava sp. TaxID=1933450 RepID=UPI003AA7CCBA
MDRSHPNALAQKLNRFLDLTARETEALAGLTQRQITLRTDQGVTEQGQANHTAFILTRGWAFSYILLQDGSRQIVDFRVAGDFLGLRGLLSPMSDLFIEPLTDIEVTEFQIEKLLNVGTQVPRLMSAILAALARDQAITVEHLVSIGRRGALERMAHFFLELGSRLEEAGLGRKDNYACPLTQYHLADALGLSAIHVNRVLRELREEGHLTFRKGEVFIEDPDQLCALAGFDPGYLKAHPVF